MRKFLVFSHQLQKLIKVLKLIGLILLRRRGKKGEGVIFNY